MSDSQYGVLCCVVLYCVVLYCVILYCIALYLIPVVMCLFHDQTRDMSSWTRCFRHGQDLSIIITGVTKVPPRGPGCGQDPGEAKQIPDAGFRFASIVDGGPTVSQHWVCVKEHASFSAQKDYSGFFGYSAKEEEW